jgi:hypothetical protein
VTFADPANTFHEKALHCYQPYGQEGLLVADLDLSTATGCSPRGHCGLRVFLNAIPVVGCIPNVS